MAIRPSQYQKIRRAKVKRAVIIAQIVDKRYVDYDRPSFFPNLNLQSIHVAEISPSKVRIESVALLTVFYHCGFMYG